MTYNFKPQDIVCVDCENHHLYTEVIDIILSREMAWVRPLMLVSINDDDHKEIYDLRGTSDLLWSINVFRPAFDTEVIPCLVELESKDLDKNHAQKYLRDFISKLWQKSSYLLTN